MTSFEKLRKASEDIIAICEKKQHTKEDQNQLLKIHQQILEAVEDLMECEGCNRIVTVNQIATITLGDESAKLCKDCGIKSLEAGKIVKKKTSRRRTQSSKKSQKSNKPETPKNTEKKELATIDASPQKSSKVENMGGDLSSLPQRDVKSSTSKTSVPEKENPVPKTKTEISVSEPPEGNESPKPNLNELYGEVESQTGINKRDVKKIHKLIEEIAYPMDLEKTIIYTVAELEKARMRIERPDAEKAISMLFDG